MAGSEQIVICQSLDKRCCCGSITRDSDVDPIGKGCHSNHPRTGLGPSRVGYLVRRYCYLFRKLFRRVSTAAKLWGDGCSETRLGPDHGAVRGLGPANRVLERPPTTQTGRF